MLKNDRGIRDKTVMILFAFFEDCLTVRDITNSKLLPNQTLNKVKLVKLTIKVLISKTRSGMETMLLQNVILLNETN